jgi:asparagine synthase (glutamine-hydrolysing)
MCGIIGIADPKGIADRGWLTAGRNVMRHRGPDDAGEWSSSDGSVEFGHRRLSIIDLSPAGHQPMRDITGELCIVFNGEIYNFQDLRRELLSKGHLFRSRSDTEVILAAYRQWGVDCVARLNGMFSFALYDAHRRMLFLTRDRAGEKPLFYHHSNGALRFASELKALLADLALQRNIDAGSLDCYLACGYVPADRCILRGFSKLPPAHSMCFDLESGKLRVWRYWQPPEIEAPAPKEQVDEMALLEELERLLEDCVTRQLVADVPVGILLSGGVDSSLVTAMAVRASPKMKTFTVRFPGHREVDETEHARLIARHFDTEHFELEAKVATADLLSRLARQFDEPMVDSSMIPMFLVSQLVREYCTVALGGDGGDELFGGYPSYSRMLQVQHSLRHIPRPVRAFASAAAVRLLPVGLKGRNFLQRLCTDLQQGLPVGCDFDAGTRRRLMKHQQVWPIVAEEVEKAHVLSHPDIVQLATRRDFANYLAEDILVKVDRASMLNSLEVRAPLLDYRLIEFAFGKVPSSLKVTTQDKKILLKRLAVRVLPAEFDLQRKQGFSVPLSQWLKAAAFRDLLHEVVMGPESIFDRRTVRGLLREQHNFRNNAERLFGLLMFGLWRREYNASL